MANKSSSASPVLKEIYVTLTSCRLASEMISYSPPQADWGQSITTFALTVLSLPFAEVNKTFGQGDGGGRLHVALKA